MWNISIDVRHHIKLMFTHFDVQVDEECRLDYLIIEDPYSLDEMRHCGICIPSPYISIGNTLHVIFVTDFVVYRTGFSAKYESVGGRSDSVEPSAQDVLQPAWLEIGDGIKQISVCTSTNQVWALDIDGRPMRRTGISQLTPQGTGWKMVGTEKFLYISVGRAGVWAVYNDSTVMYREGTFRTAETAGTSWQAVHIDTKITSSLFNFKAFPVETGWSGHSIDRIHSGKDFVWIIASYPHFTYGYTIVRKGITLGSPEGTSWDSAQTANMKEVSVSSRTGQLWAVEIGGRVWRSPFYCEISEKRLCAEDEVMCPYSEKCIKECSVCDGIVDCGNDDDTDERNCWLASCPEKHRRMCDGEVGCYSPTRVCDGDRNCGEITEDERDCPEWKSGDTRATLGRGSGEARAKASDLRPTVAKPIDARPTPGRASADSLHDNVRHSCVDYRKRNYLLQRDEIQCRDLSGCVKITKICDGQEDCSDGSDEIKCDEFCSLHGAFGDAAYWKCRGSPGCVKGEFLCNGISDCADGSDEEDCDESCTSIGYWPCKDSIPPFPRCINGQGRCNRAVQCRDFSDEIGCDYCGLHAMAGFTKWDRKIFMEGTDVLYLHHEVCIPFESVCDGHDDWYYQDEVSCFQEEYCHTVGGFDCGWPWHQCISQHLVCDEHPDCESMDDATLAFYGPADEQNCGSCAGYWTALEEYKDKRKARGLTVSDDPYNHVCSSGKCAATFNICDDRDFCGNWEDEQDCEGVDCLHDDRKCEATHKCVSDDSCNGVPGCLDFTDEKNCGITTCADTAVRLGVSAQYKEIKVTQNCDGKEDCRTGVDENPRRCGM
ncbi:LRP1B [Branchiostoma lanceolatum]|uniref:LRP1B protein n=1 Tax=Branchiostoma lanceolatum TaxID=7740 RepID=A0A8J9W195_BRALA|nr:LRP1B [Branchiostoma lanceolatum]